MSKPRYFLAKSEPGSYSIDDLEKDKVTPWDGVHNYQAINFIKEWKPGDFVFIYHSMGEAAIAGLGKVINEPRKDENDPRDISWLADIEFIEKYPKEQRINLKQIKATGMFPDFHLIRNSRLSVMPCPDDFVKWFFDQQ
jgi:predicted RNA-binding protein with PUA-like domain